MGNNDGKFHYQGVDPKDKADFYTFYFSKWFEGLSYNSKLKSLPEMKKTFLKGGYYRVDVDNSLSVLALNSLYWNKKNDPTNQTTEGADQFKWFEAQLKGASPH